VVKLINIDKPKISEVLTETADVYEELEFNNKLEDSLVEDVVIERLYNLKLSFDSCVFRNVVFIDCDLKKIDLLDVIFENCDFSNCIFSDSSIYRVEFKNCKLLGTRLEDSFFKNVLFENSMARYSNFSYSKFSGVNIVQSDFSEAVFQEIKNEKFAVDQVELNRAIFTGSKLKNLDISSSSVEDIDVRIEDIRGVKCSVAQALDFTRFMGIKIK